MMQAPKQYRINETAMAAFKTDIAVGPLGRRRVPRGERSAEYNRNQSRTQRD